MPPVACRSLALVLSALCLLLLGTAAARAEVYWADSASFSDNWIARATNAGGSVTAPFIPSTREVTGMASDGSHLYWSRWAGGIWRANLDGSNPEELIATPSGAGSLATDGTYFYWSVPNEPRISRARVDGSDVEADFVLLEDGAWPAGVTTDGAYVYWTDNGLGRIGRIRTDGSGRQDQFIENVGYPNGITVAGGYLYWANGDSADYGLGRARADGTGANASWLSTTSITADVKVGGGFVYWTAPSNGRIGRVPVSGSGANANFVVGLTWPTGLFVTAPGFSGTPASSAYGNLVLGRRATQTFTITNDSLPFAGGQPLTFAAGAVTLTGTNANQFSIGSNGCAGQTVAPGGSCSVEVTFTPTSVGAKSASLRFADNATSSPQTFALTGRGTQGTASLSATTAAFGDVRTGVDSVTRSVTVTNTASGANAGPISYAAGAVTLTGANADQYAIGSDGCSGSTVAPAGTCTVEVTFTPTSDGAANASLRLVDDAPGSPRSVALSGRGITPALAIDPASHDFGDLRGDRSSAPFSFTVENTGNVAVTLASSAAALTGLDASSWSIDDDQCSGTTLAAGDDCTVAVVFSPRDLNAQAAALEVTGDVASASAALSGSGVIPVIFAAAGGGPPFGTVLVGSRSGQSKYGIYNAGSGPAFIAADGIWIDGDDAAQFEITDDDCSGTTLLTGEDCFVTVVYAPTEAGSPSARLHFSEDAADPSAELLWVDLTAVAVAPAPALAVTPPTHDFGSVRVGTTTAPISLRVANSGTGAATLPADAVTVDGASTFAVAGDDCSGATLDPGEHCTVSIAFGPQATGAATATVEIADGAGGTLSAGLSGNGREPARRDPDPEPEPRRDPAPAPRTETPPPATPPTPAPDPRPTPRRTTRPRLTMEIAGVVDSGGGGRGRGRGGSGGGAWVVVGADGTLRLRCALSGAALHGCAAVVRSAGGGRALGGGSARAGGRGSAATVVVRLGVRGRAALARALGGVPVTVTIAATTRDGRRIVRRVRVTLLAKRQRVITQPGAFEPDAAALTPAGAAFLGDVARRLRGARAIVCTGFTATRGEQGSDAAADALGLQRGRAACALLRRQGVNATLTPRSGGREEPRAGNDDEAGRARNRRVELTISR